MSDNNAPNRKEQDKGNAPLNQLQNVFHYLKQHIATASMVADATGIYQKNICRYKRDLEKSGQLWEVEKRLCKVTGFRAMYLTTDPANAPKNPYNQLTLF